MSPALTEQRPPRHEKTIFWPVRGFD